MKEKIKQKRSIITEDKILNTAKTLFSEKGFYNVSTNEIAKVATISIGTLYHHFSDKNKILTKLLDQQNDAFKIIFEKNNPASTQKIAELKTNPQKWIEDLVTLLISMHQQDLAFIKELNALYYNQPEVKKQRDAHRQAFQNQTYDILKSYQDELLDIDLEAFSIIIYEFISSLVDQVTLFPCSIKKERILESGIHTIAEMVTNLFKK